MDIIIKDKNDNITNIINNAIKEVNKNGGGKVIIDGIYNVSSIELLDNVILYLNKNSLLKMTSNIDELFDINLSRNTNLDVPSWENCYYDGKPSKYFIYAFNRNNCGIMGEGIIDGNEEIFYGVVTKDHIEGSFYPRVPLIYFENCNNLIFKDITLKRSAFWTLHLVGSNDILIENINIDNNLILTNSDGIDPDHCKNVVIKNCNISCADDCIVLKTTEANKKYGSLENINISNCNLRSTSAALKFGTESVSDFKNINITNCNIYSSNRGISIMLRDSGNISNVKFENIKIDTKRFSPIHWWGKAEPIAITALRRFNDTKIGNIDNISFINIDAISENGILIYGEDNIENIKFYNIDLKIELKTEWEKKNIDLRPSIYGILEYDSFLFYKHGIKNIDIKNFNYFISDNMKKYIK